MILKKEKGTIKLMKESIKSARLQETDVRLAEGGWKSTTVSEFLGLSREESALIEMRLELSCALRDWRRRSSFTQNELATRIGSSQSRIAKIERGDPHVSIDLMFKALLACGAGPADLAAVFEKAAKSTGAPDTK